jgi:hypothetical protein
MAGSRHFRRLPCAAQTLSEEPQRGLMCPRPNLGNEPIDGAAMRTAALAMSAALQVEGSMNLMDCVGQEVERRFVINGHGLRFAYAEVGEGPPVGGAAPNALGHSEHGLHAQRASGMRRYRSTME